MSGKRNPHNFVIIYLSLKLFINFFVGIDATIHRPPTNLSNYSTSHLHSSSSVSPMPRSVVTEDYTYSTRNGPGGSYTITKGPYIRVESNHQGPDYRAHLGPRP